MDAMLPQGAEKEAGLRKLLRIRTVWSEPTCRK
jgi:hypothetical protein